MVKDILTRLPLGTKTPIKIKEDANSDNDNNRIDGEGMTGVKGQAVSNEGLILPRKLHNPCLENKDRKELHRELMLNQKLPTLPAHLSLTAGRPHQFNQTTFSSSPGFIAVCDFNILVFRGLTIRGKNVLNQKSELQKAMEKHKELVIKRELEAQRQENMTPFEKVIEQRAKKLEILEKDLTEKEISQKEPEFLQIHAKLRARMDAK